MFGIAGETKTSSAFDGESQKIGQSIKLTLIKVFKRKALKECFDGDSPGTYNWIRRNYK